MQTGQSQQVHVHSLAIPLYIFQRGARTGDIVMLLDCRFNHLPTSRNMRDEEVIFGRGQYDVTTVH